MNRRQLLAVVGSASAAALSGCPVSGTDESAKEPNNESASDEQNKSSDEVGSTASGSRPEPTGDGQSDHEPAAQTADPDHEVQLSNDSGESVELTVEVRREATGQTVYRQTHGLQPDEETVVYNTRRADPDGIERFTVVISMGAATERVELETSACYGMVIGRVTDDAELTSTYSIC